jgi:hypothetical protein
MQMQKKVSVKNLVHTKLEDLIKHITHTSREATPIGKDEKRQLFSFVKVFDSLRCFIRTVREPNTTRLEE